MLYVLVLLPLAAGIVWIAFTVACWIEERRA